MLRVIRIENGMGQEITGAFQVGVRSSGGFCLRDCFFFVVVEEEEDGDDGVDFGNVKTTGLDVRFVVLAFVVVVVVVVDLSIAALLTGPRVSCSSSS